MNGIEAAVTQIDLDWNGMKEAADRVLEDVMHALPIGVGASSTALVQTFERFGKQMQLQVRLTTDEEEFVE